MKTVPNMIKWTMIISQEMIELTTRQPNSEGNFVQSVMLFEKGDHMIRQSQSQSYVEPKILTIPPSFET